MPDWFWKFMLLVFAIHCLVFTILALKRRRLPAALAAGAFLLLFLAISIRIWLPENQIMGIKTSWYLRIPAWGMALTGLIMSWCQRHQLSKNSQSN